MPVVIETGGAVAGAPNSFKVLGQRPTVLVQGGSHVIDAMTIDVQDSMYGIFFSFTIPRTEWAGDGTQNEASYYAGLVQYIAGRENTVAVAYAQDVNAAGALIDTLIVTVGTPDGLNTANVTVPLLAAGQPSTFAALDKAEATLVKTAALT